MTDISVTITESLITAALTEQPAITAALSQTAVTAALSGDTITAAVTSTEVSASVSSTTVSASVTSQPVSVTVSPGLIETDPVFLASQAANITSQHVTDLNSVTAFIRTVLDDANAAAVRTTIGAQAALGYTPVDSASASWIDLTDGGATTLHSHAGGGGTWGSITGTLSNQTDLQAALDAKQNSLTFPLAASLGGTGVANGASATLTLPNAATTITTGGTIALGGFTLTVPATGTAALLATGNQFSVGQKIYGTADEVQLAIRANSSQTNSILDIKNSAGNVEYIRITKDGNLSLGSASHTTVKLYISTTNQVPALYEVVNSASGAGLNAFSAQVYSRHTSGNVNSIGAALYLVTHDRAGTVTTALCQDLGFRIQSSAGNITTQKMLGSTTWAFSFATVTNAIFVDIPTPTISGGTVTNLYGIRIADQTGAGTLNYAIYTNAGIVRFGDTVNTTASYQVDGTQVVTNRVIDARIDDAINSGDATTDGVIDAIRDALITHGLIAAA